MGSSPRMRGTRSRHARGLPGHGIIPAYAGNTADSFKSVAMMLDHPRVCGEHEDVTTEQIVQTGSSPRMRGTLGAGYLPVQPYGIIPAYAGNTRSSHRSRTPERDHPRVCGEHFPPCFLSFPDWGSSPRMRGTPMAVRGKPIRPGIIPAYAGNTFHTAILDVAERDHPRVCGEHRSGRRGTAV